MNKILVYLILINFSLDCANSQNERYTSASVTKSRAVGNIAKGVMTETSQNKILRKRAENTTEIMNFTISQNENCIVPATVGDTKWVLNGTQNETSPGSRVPDSTVIRAICNSSFGLVYGAEDVTKCHSGNWTPYDLICLRHFGDIQLSCRLSGGCVIPKQPDNGKWLDEETGQELRTGLCVKQELSVTGSCNKNFNYFGDRNSPTIECTDYGSLLVASFYCTDQDPKGYASNEYCIMPKPLLNTQWLTLKLPEEFLAGQYVKSGTVVRASCITNFTKIYDGNYAFACREGKWHEHPWNRPNSIVRSWRYFETAQCKKIYLEEVGNSTGCLIPEPPVNGVWATWDTKVPLIPGKYAGPWTRIIAKCNKRHQNFPVTDFSECTDGEWIDINYFGECEPICEPLLSTDQYKVICTIGNKISENCTEPVDGIIAEISCKSTYQNLHIWESKSKLRVCLRGKWNNNVLPNCIPKTKCGLKAPNLQPLVVNGAEVSKGGYPWHVALYKIQNENRKYLCGGSLISDRLIITAAHCVTYQSTGKPLPESLFEVSVGKQFSNYSDPRDKNSQSSTIVKMFIPDSYKADAKKLIGDIAILVTKDSFNLHDTVLPVCVNFGTDKLEQKLLTDHKKLGYVPGFGVTKTGNISETLKEIAVPLIRHENCSKYLPEEFIEYYSYDKFCAGLLNQSTAVCVGDSGGGLVVQNPIDNRFYLAGIVSASPLDPVSPLACDIQQYTLFTNVADYVDFISDKGSEYLQTKPKTRMNVSLAERDYQNYVKWYKLGPNRTHQAMYQNLKGIPYLALIGTKVKNENNWFCNGHLISDRFILTAAICASNRSSPLIVRLGIDTTPNVTDFQVVETYVSPAYRPLQVYSDIALMKLSEGVEFSEFIHPALLSGHKFYELVKASERTATWSKTAGKRVDIYLSLQRARICDMYFKRYLGDDLAEGYVNDVQFCAKLSNAPIQPVVPDLCDVLPGGALPLFDYDSALESYFHRIAGITTNLKDCSKVKGVMLFTNVSAFVPWIEGIVWPPNEKVLKVIN